MKGTALYGAARQQVFAAFNTGGIQHAHAKATAILEAFEDAQLSKAVA